MADVDDRWYRLDRATGEKVPTAAHGTGKRWQARWRDAAGVQRKRNFARKAEAETHIAAVLADLARGTYVDQKAGRVTLQVYAETRWLPAQLHLRANSAETYRSHLANHIGPALGGRRIGTLTRTDVKAFIASLSGKLAPATVGTVFAVLQAVLMSAVDDGVIGANPCARVPLPPVERRPVRLLTPAEIAGVADAIYPPYRVAVWLGAGAGLRQGEALGLTTDRVEFLRRRVKVEQQLQRGQSAPPKTRAGVRTVPVDDLVLNAVTAHLAEYPVTPGGLVVRTGAGRPVLRQVFWRCWATAVERAGLPAGTRYHDLRHFYAASLIAAGLHPKAIQVRLGHATISETMDTYGHLFPDAEDAGRGALDAAFAAGVPAMCPAVES